MNKITSYITAAAMSCLLLAGMTSCSDYLDKSPDSDVSEEEAFKNFRNFQGFVEEMYYCIPNFTTGYWNNSFNWGEDEIINVGKDYYMGYKVDQGDFWGWQSEHDGWQCGFMDISNFSTRYFPDQVGNRPTLWQGSWYGIRKANLGLENLDRLTECTDEQYDIIRGQLLFFRGFFHFQLMQYFGGLPYIDQVVTTDRITLPRLSYQECADLVAKDLREAADLLPINWDNTDTGTPTRGANDLRINKIMALGYLGKNLLWAGSPLMNSESTGAQTYNDDYCRRAAEALGELLDLVERGETQYSLVDFDNYKELFLTHGKGGLMPGSTEAIFRNPVIEWNRSNWGQTRSYGTMFLDSDGGNIFLPTANYVNYYGMANGLPLDDPDSHFDKSHPWKDRDPRFYHDIRFDGCKLEQSENPDANKIRYAPLYTGGIMRDVIKGSRTGYLNYKFVRDDFNQWDNQGAGNWGAHNHMLVPYMRLADVYLMYAEAVAAANRTCVATSSRCNLSALDAVNKIRRRAGVEDVNAKFTGSFDAFIGELRRERAVELAFEGHRFNDLRRWLLLDKYPYNIKTSQEFQRTGDLTGIENDSSKGINKNDPTQNEVIGFHEEIILTRNLATKHYWLPLKVNDTKMYVEFGQNPGW